MGFGNVFILGDSFSTFEGYIPEGYLTYYSENTEKNNKKRKKKRGKTNENRPLRTEKRGQGSRTYLASDG